MKLANASVLVTGANRGIGLAFATAALARGAGKVYAGARNPESINLPGVTMFWACCAWPGPSHRCWPATAVVRC
jgi:NAD(P)-dependent dehydrogenase (short-subunit alcohol dehydrogenase family)